MGKLRKIRKNLITTILSLMGAFAIFNLSSVQGYCGSWNPDGTGIGQGTVNETVEKIQASNDGYESGNTVKSITAYMNYETYKDGSTEFYFDSFTMTFIDSNGEEQVSTQQASTYMSVKDRDTSTLVFTSPDGNITDTQAKSLIETYFVQIFGKDALSNCAITIDFNEYRDNISYTYNKETSSKQSEMSKDVISSVTDSYSNLLDDFKEVKIDGNNTVFSKEDMDKFVTDFLSVAKSCATTKSYGSSEIKGRLLSFALECNMSKELTFKMLDYIVQGNCTQVKQSDVLLYKSGDKTCEEICDTLFTYFAKIDNEDAISGGSYFRNDVSDYYITAIGSINGDYVASNNGGVGTLVGSGFLHILSAVSSPLVTDVATSIIHDLAWGIVDILAKVDESIINFSPSIDVFLGYFGGLNADGTQNEDTQIFNLNKLFYYLGGILAVLIFVIALFKIIINPENLADESRSREILTLVFRFIFILLTIYLGKTIISTIYGLCQDVWDWCFNSSTSVFNVNSDMDTFVLYKTISLVTYNYFNIEWTYEIIGVIFNIVIGIMLLKNVVILFAEAIERYVVSCLLYFMYPTAMSLGVSKSTSNVTKSYFRMLLTQVFMLFMNIYFIAGFMQLLRSLHSWADSMYGVIFVLSYLKVAQAFDSYLNSLGLSVAHTTGSAGRELLGAGATALTSLMMLGRGITALGNAGVKVTGAGLSQGALAFGKGGLASQRLFNFGENLRTGGLKGVFGGTRMNGRTADNYFSAKGSMLNGKNSFFDSGLNGRVSASTMNARISPDSMLKDYLGRGKGLRGSAGENIASASFGNNGLINAKADNGFGLTMANTKEKLGGNLEKGKDFSNARFCGNTARGFTFKDEDGNVHGQELFGVMNFSQAGGIRQDKIGQSMTLKAGSTAKSMDGTYAFTDVERSFGFDLSKTQRGKDILEGKYGDVTFTMGNHGNISAVCEDTYGEPNGYFTNNGGLFINEVRAKDEPNYSEIIRNCNKEAFAKTYAGEVNMKVGDADSVHFIDAKALDDQPELYDIVTERAFWEQDVEGLRETFERDNQEIRDKIQELESKDAFAHVLEVYNATSKEDVYLHPTWFEESTNILGQQLTQEDFDNLALLNVYKTQYENKVHTYEDILYKLDNPNGLEQILGGVVDRPSDGSLYAVCRDVNGHYEVYDMREKEVTDFSNKISDLNFSRWKAPKA